MGHQGDTEDEDATAAVVGVAVWNHGVLEPAKLTPVCHVVHVVRHLADYHEPTLAALRRQHLRKLVDAQGEERVKVCHAAAEAFLEQPTGWRDVGETNAGWARERRPATAYLLGGACTDYMPELRQLSIVDHAPGYHRMLVWILLPDRWHRNAEGLSHAWAGVRGRQKLRRSSQIEASRFAIVFAQIP